MMNFNFYNPTHLLFGSGKINELGDQKLPGKKALLLISAGQSAKTSGALDKTQKQLARAGVEYVLCANIHENPAKELVMEAAQVTKDNACDFIVALGGGAVLDSAVAVAAMATNPGDLWDYVNGGTGKGLPLVNTKSPSPSPPAPGRRSITGASSPRQTPTKRSGSAAHQSWCPCWP